MDVEIFLERSEKGEIIVMHEKFIYMRVETLGKNIRWQCCGARKCKGSIVTTKYMMNPIVVRPHDHEPGGSRAMYAVKKWLRKLTGKETTKIHKENKTEKTAEVINMSNDQHVENGVTS